MEFVLEAVTGTPGVLFSFDAQAWRQEPVAAYDAFLAGRRPNGRPLRKSTFAIYRGMYQRLLEWLESYGMSVHDLGARHLEGFLASRKLSDESRHRYLLAFTEVYQHLALLRDEEGNPARELLTATRAPDRQEPEALTPEEVQKVLATLSMQKDRRWKSRRFETLVCVLLGAGLRTSELLTLRIRDIEECSFVHIQAQRPRPKRKVPLHGFARGAVQQWMTYRARELSHIPGDRVFPGNEGGAALAASTLFRQVKTVLEASGITRRYEGPMLLRNTCGAAWLSHVELYQVKEWLGHELARSTEQLLPAAQAWKGSRVLLDPFDFGRT